MRPRRKTVETLQAALACGLLSVLNLLAACGRGAEQVAAGMTGGEPHRGREAVRKYGCATCHTIPGVEGADGLVGPSLERVASRMYLAGRVPNTPENMVHWIRFPREVDRETVMPHMNVTEQDGRDIAAYLYTWR